MKLSKKGKSDIAKAMALYAQIGITMATCVGLSLLIGTVLDNWLGTSPWFLLIFVLIGIVAAIRNMYIMVMNQFKD